MPIFLPNNIKVAFYSFIYFIHCNMVCVCICVLLALTHILSRTNSYFVILFRTDWLYSQKYDRDNASINRSIIQPISRSIAKYEDESAA